MNALRKRAVQGHPGGSARGEADRDFARCSWAGDGPLVGSASNGQLFIFDRHQRQVTHTIQLRSLGTPLAGVPEAHGVVHLTAACTRNSPPSPRFLLHLRRLTESLLLAKQPTAMCTA